MEHNPEGEISRDSGLRRSGRPRLASDTQVLIGVGGMCALFALSVAVAVFLIVSLEDDATNLTERHVQYAAAIHEAALSAKAMANEQRGFLLSDDPRYLAQFEADAAAARVAFRLARAHAVAPQHQLAVEQARAQFERWLRVVRADVATYRQGGRERAIQASLGPTRQLRKTYERSLADAYALGLRSISGATTSLSASASRSVTILLVYLALALVICVGIALWIVRTILKPAFVLSRNAIEVLTRGRMLVAEDERGSHYGVAVEVPVEVVNALADSALTAQQAVTLRQRREAQDAAP